MIFTKSPFVNSLALPWVAILTKFSASSSSVPSANPVIIPWGGGVLSARALISSRVFKGRRISLVLLRMMVLWGVSSISARVPSPAMAKLSVAVPLSVGMANINRVAVFNSCISPDWVCCSCWRSYLVAVKPFVIVVPDMSRVRLMIPPI